MGATSECPWRGAAAAVVAMAGLAFCVSADAAGCSTGRAALHEMLDAEDAFSPQAQTFVPAAFLAFLAEDAWVLHPGPELGRPLYQGLKDDKNQLEWYPVIGDIAPAEWGG